MRILVTGANGFVGAALCRRLLKDPGIEVRGAVRHSGRELPADVESCVVEGLGPDSDWRDALQGIDAVVHCAARVHVMRETAADSLAEFRRVNVDGTATLARQAAAAGVRRMVFVSSIKVNGERTDPGHPFTADAEPLPEDPYGVSKLEAEARLKQVAGETGIEVVIVRPPLVYGPGVGANFGALIRLASSGLPIPLARTGNLRSLVFVGNLVDLLACLLTMTGVSGRTFLVSDGEDVSTSDLLRAIGKAMKRRVRLFPVPRAMLGLAFAAINKRSYTERLLGNLQVDISPVRALGWNPPVSFEAGIQATTDSFLASGDA